MARILIIDDDKSFREALAESIRDFGHDVVEACGAQEAFKLINQVDAAFLDLNMPGISGIEFLREAKPLAPVIVLTAFADSSNTIEAIRLGAFDHLTKPIGRVDLQQVLAEALKKSQIAPWGDFLPSGDGLIGFSPGMREVRCSTGNDRRCCDSRLGTAPRRRTKNDLSRSLCHPSHPGDPLYADR
jgi:CheY-like chemotaxis protein